MTDKPLQHPVLVISYNDDSRGALEKSLTDIGVAAVPCVSFIAAEDIAINGLYSGILVELQSIIKAKNEEKIVACSLTGFYPTLRVRALGSMLVPMAMPGDAKQDRSLADFINKTCPAFVPRRMRLHRRRNICITTLINSPLSEERGFTLDISWGGVFLVNMFPERFHTGDELSFSLTKFDITVPATVRWCMCWGDCQAPGIGVEFNEIDEELEKVLYNLLKHERKNDRYRMVSK
jgi:hypothetical protein